MSNTKHTPTPWNVYVEVKPETGYALSVRVESASGVIAKILSPAGDGAHIVKCVNAHDELVAALKDAAEFMEKHFDAKRFDKRLTDARMAGIRAALAKVQS